MKSDVYGLVLAGGKSQRMGRDKTLINWHGKIQREYLADLLDDHCAGVFVSCRPDQQAEIGQTRSTVPDTYDNLGQYGALLTAMDKYPDRTWLVVACDMPLIGSEDIGYLMSQRDSSKLATAYSNPENGLPEPLAAIWEPASRDRLLELLEQGITCPRKALIKSEGKVKLVAPLSAEAVMNTNTPEDAELAQRLIAKRKKDMVRG